MKKITKMVRKVRKSFHYGEKGFTLIELLIVIAILGVLAAVVVPSVSQFMNRGEQQAADIELATLQTATLAFMQDNSGDRPCTNNDSGLIIAADIDPYLNKSLAELEYGIYSVASNGTVTTTWTP